MKKKKISPASQTTPCASTAFFEVKTSLFSMSLVKNTKLYYVSIVYSNGKNHLGIFFSVRASSFSSAVAVPSGKFQLHSKYSNKMV